MSRSGLLFAVALAVAVACGAGPARAAFYFDIWQPSADGSIECHPTEGYAIGGDGNYRFTKFYHHFTFMGFDGLSDGPDKMAPDQQGDGGDGVAMVDWLVGKKAFGASIYIRDADHQTCDPYAAVGAYLNDPITIMGFRCANVGDFTDRSAAGQGFGGCCATYSSPLLGGGENSCVAWRIGTPPYTGKGDKGTGGEWWKISSLDTQWPGLEVFVGNLPGSNFTSDGAGLGGWSDHASRYAFSWMVQNSDAHMINAATLGTADCSGMTGGDEPRDRAQDMIYGEGWFAKHVDRCIINGIANDPEMKGLVFHSLGIELWANTAVFSRDQSGGIYGPYLAIYATYEADCDNDGCVDVVDLLTMAGTWGLSIPEIGFDPECDLNCDGWIDVVDLLTLAAQFGQVPCLNE